MEISGQHGRPTNRHRSLRGWLLYLSLLAASPAHSQAIAVWENIPGSDGGYLITSSSHAAFGTTTILPGYTLNVKGGSTIDYMAISGLSGGGTQCLSVNNAGQVVPIACGGATPLQTFVGSTQIANPTQLLQFSSNTFAGSFIGPATAQISLSANVCDGVSNALTWNGQTFGCNTITSSGGSGTALGVFVGAVQISSPTTQITFDPNSFYGNLAGGATAQIFLDAVSLSTGVTGLLATTSIAAGSLGSGVINTNAAGGSLTGSYPNPSLSNTGVVAATYGNATNSAQIAIDVAGRITTASNVPISGVSPAGAAGGGLFGTYPNPGVVAVSLSTGVTGSLPAASIAAGSLGPFVIASSVAVSGITAATYGNATNSAQCTFGIDGRATACSNVAISGVPPSGTAGGGLFGTYPNPGVVAISLSTGVTGQLPAASIAAGSLGPAVIVSSVAVGSINSSNQIINGTIIGANLANNTLTNTQMSAATYSNITIPAANVASGSLGVTVIASSIAVSGVTAATYGNSTNVGQFTVGVDGRLTAASNVAITGTTPGGAAGGDLNGSYPNPTLQPVQGNVAAFTNAITNVSSVTITSSSGLLIDQGAQPVNSYPNATTIEIANANTGIKHVIQNLSSGASASSDIKLTDDLGGDTSYYIRLGIRSSQYSNPNFSVLKSSSGFVATSDSNLVIWSNTNGGLNGAQNGSIIMGSSNPLIANQALTISRADAVNPGSTTVYGNLDTQHAFNMQGIITTNTSLVLVSSNSVVLASATVSPGITITLPSSSQNLGQTLTITKIDPSTRTVTINTAGNDLMVATNTYTLNAYFQTDSIISDGNGHWIPWGQGLQITPSFVGGWAGVSGNTLNLSSAAACNLFTSNVPIAVSSIAFAVGTQSGNMDVGIYSTGGALLVSNGGSATLATGTRAVAMSTPYNLSPGQYWSCWSGSNTSVALLGPGNAPTQDIPTFFFCPGTNYPLPTFLPFPCSKTSSNKIWSLFVIPSGGQF